MKKHQMTRRRMENYVNLQREIAMLEEQILNAGELGYYVTDEVQSASEFPYNKKIVTVKGYKSRSIPRLIEQKKRHEAECDAIENFIVMVEDSVTRQLLARIYIEDKTFGEAAQIVGYSERQAIRIVKAFFERISAK